MILRIHVDTVIPCGDHRILCAGRHVRPVVTGITAVDSGKGNVAGEYIPVEVRLNDNIGRIAADQLPEAVSPQAGRTVQHLVAGGIQTHLDIRLITGSRACTQTAAVMGDALGIVGVKAIVKGQGKAVGLFLNIALLVETGACHMGRVAETPSVEIGTRHAVTCLSLDLVGGGFCAITVVLPIDDRLHHSGVEVVHLAVEVKGGVRGHRVCYLSSSVQLCQLELRIRFSRKELACADGRVITGHGSPHIDAIQTAAALGKDHGRIVGVAVLFKGCAHLCRAVHYGAVQFYLKIIRAEARSVLLCGIHAVSGASNVGILVFTGEHVVLLQRKLQGHAAQRNVISLSLLVIAKGTVGIAAAGQMGIKTLKIVLLLQLSHSGIVLRLAIRQGAGIVAVQEAVLQLVAQNLLAGCVLHHVVQLQNGIVAVVVLTNAEQEVKIIGGILLHVQRQRPGILGEIFAIRCGADAIHIVAGLALHQDANHRRAGKSGILIGIAEAPQIAPGLAAISGTAIVETLGGKKGSVLFIVPEHLARIQFGDAVRRSCQHSGLRRGGYAILQGRNRSRSGHGRLGGGADRRFPRYRLLRGGFLRSFRRFLRRSLRFFRLLCVRRVLRRLLLACQLRHDGGIRCAAIAGGQNLHRQKTDHHSQRQQ